MDKIDILSLSWAAAVFKTGARVSGADWDEVALTASPFATIRGKAELEDTGTAAGTKTSQAFLVAWVLVEVSEAAVTETSGGATTEPESVLILEGPT